MIYSTVDVAYSRGDITSIRVERRYHLFQSRYYTIIDFSEVDVKIYQPEKVSHIIKATLLRVDKSIFI